MWYRDRSDSDVATRPLAVGQPAVVAGHFGAGDLWVVFARRFQIAPVVATRDHCQPRDPFVDFDDCVGREYFPNSFSRIETRRRPTTTTPDRDQ